MVGMLQIITYLLCVYLIFKGVEIFQLAVTSPRNGKSRIVAFVIGAGMMAASVVAAIAFSIWITDQAVGLQGNFPILPAAP